MDRDEKTINDIIESKISFVKKFVNENGYNYTIRLGVANRTLNKIIQGGDIKTDTVMKLYKFLHGSEKNIKNT